MKRSKMITDILRVAPVKCIFLIEGQQLESKSQGVSIYDLPVFGSMAEMEERISLVEKKTCIVGYVDDLNPVIAKVEEFDMCNSYLILFERVSGCKFHPDSTSQKYNLSAPLDLKSKRHDPYKLAAYISIRPIYLSELP